MIIQQHIDPCTRGMPAKKADQSCLIKLTERVTAYDNYPTCLVDNNLAWCVISLTQSIAQRLLQSCHQSMACDLMTQHFIHYCHHRIIVR